MRVSNQVSGFIEGQTIQLGLPRFHFRSAVSLFAFVVEPQEVENPVDQEKGHFVAEGMAGFRRVGVLEAVGRKFDRWLDSVIMQRPLGPGDAVPPTAPGGVAAESSR